MPYATDRRIHDADAHIMETSEFLAQFADERVAAFDGLRRIRRASRPAKQNCRHCLRKHRDPDYRARDEAEIMLRKNWAATGAYFKQDRPRALDLLGFSSQLVFNTFVNGHMATLERTSTDLDLMYGVAEAHNRAMLDFCNVDKRLLPTAYVPLADFARTQARSPSRRSPAGFPGLLIPSQCPRGHSPEPHRSLSAVGRGGRSRRADSVPRRRRRHPARSRLLQERPADSAGLSRRRRELPLGGLHGDSDPVMQTLATLILDGILERFPEAQVRCHRTGRRLDRELDAHARLGLRRVLRHEERLQKLSMRPSGYVRRQIRATPYPAEDVGWIIRETFPGGAALFVRLPARGRRPQPDQTLRNHAR